MNVTDKSENISIEKNSNRKQAIAGYIAAAIWPFVYYYRLVLPGFDFSLKIVNDFWYLYYCKLHVLDNFSNLNFPLWSPSESAGIPFYSNPFTQIFYILNLPLTLFYKMFSGYSYADHQLYTVFGVSIFSVGLLLWLRSLKVNMLYALLAACLIAVSSKMSEILRFTNAVHTIAWLPLILYGCTMALSKKKTLLSFALIFFPTVFLITAGYPYNAYYSFFLIIPYIILLVYLRKKSRSDCEADRPAASYFTLVFTAIAGASALCYPYIRSISQLFDQIGSRKGDDFEFSTFFKFTYTDTIGSWIFPPAAHIEGWCYSGMLTFFLITFLFVYSALNFKENTFRFRLLIVAALWLVFISYLSYGSDSYLFTAFWNYIPGFSRLRIIARMNIILLPVIAFLLAYSIKIFCDLITGKKFMDRKMFITLATVMLIVYAAVLSIQFHFLNNPVLQTSTIAFKKTLLTEMDPSHAIRYGAISFGVFFLFLIISRFRRSEFLKYVFLIATAVIIIIDQYSVGANQWVGRQLPGDSERKVLNVAELNMQSFSTPRDDRNILIQVTPSFSIVAIDEWSFERYKDFRKQFEEDAGGQMTDMTVEAFETVMGLKDGRKLFLTNNLTHDGVTEFYRDMLSFDSASSARIRVNEYTGDRLELELESDREGALHFIDNWDKDWKATVNGADTPVNLSLGTFKSVKFGAGRNKIVFSYEPEFFD